MRDIAVWIQGVAVVGMVLVAVYGWVTAHQIEKYGAEKRKKNEGEGEHD